MPTYASATALAHLHTVLPTLAGFRTWTGEVTEAAARGHIYVGDAPAGTTRPFVVLIDDPEQYVVEVRGVGTSLVRSHGIVVYAEKDIASANQTLAKRKEATEELTDGFQDLIGLIKDAAGAANGALGMLNLQELSIDKLGLPEPAEQGDPTKPYEFWIGQARVTFGFD